MANYVVIGASSGIGLALAKQLALNGERVMGTYCKHKPDEVIAGVEYFYLDVMANEIDLSFLPATIQGLAYCPGSIQLKPFGRIKDEDFLQDYKLQVLGAIKVLQAAFPHLKAAENSSVVMYSTVAVQSGLPYHSLVSSSKGAVEGLARSLAAEWAPSIRVNCIAPSLTDTPLAAGLLNSSEKRDANAKRHPLKRIGTATDIANLSAFLLSDAAGWMTGQVIHIDGGMSTLKI